MRFLVDRCAGRRLALWLREQGHDVREALEVQPDPGDQALLQWAVSEQRILITIDSDFGTLVYLRGQSHCGLIRLPDVPARRRIALMARLIELYPQELQTGAVFTVGTDRVRISQAPTER
ncbi:DUF5615 family PIN-like protein [Halochromatium glycolicum]|uniref:DUF5615 domain-containing protein n=1 Tax=Halochromatium glycolicum TaxID=85075 RepID=A0AAJ0U890_9GAMM|nr:hypothetical protein [Halochromatium glycolicum]